MLARVRLNAEEFLKGFDKSHEWEVLESPNGEVVTVLCKACGVGVVAYTTDHRSTFVSKNAGNKPWERCWFRTREGLKFKREAEKSRKEFLVK